MTAEDQRALAFWASERAKAAGRLRAARLLSAPNANLRALQARWAPLKRQAGILDSPDQTFSRVPLIGVEDYRDQIVLQGPPGTTGAQGIPGVPGPSGQSTVFTQVAPATVWTIVHGLGYNPQVSAFDTNNAPISGQVSYDNPGVSLTITFVVAIAGKAYLS